MGLTPSPPVGKHILAGATTGERPRLCYRGDGLYDTSAPRAVYNAGSLTHMRSRFVAMLAAADQPRYNFNNRIMAKA